MALIFQLLFLLQRPYHILVDIVTLYKNVLAICDFDLRFTFVVARWPSSTHDTRVFNDALERYGSTFPLPPEGILVISPFDIMLLCSYNCY
jgi:hypothetical protein